MTRKDFLDAFEQIESCLTGKQLVRGSLCRHESKYCALGQILVCQGEDKAKMRDTDHLCQNVLHNTDDEGDNISDEQAKIIWNQHKDKLIAGGVLNLKMATAILVANDGSYAEEGRELSDMVLMKIRRYIRSRT